MSQNDPRSPEFKQAHKELAHETLYFPEDYKHESHRPVQDISQTFAGSPTRGARLADKVVHGMGSWTFLIVQSAILIAWVLFNTIGRSTWDPYPFILMNLFLSLQAAYAAPLILMSENRQTERDRVMAANDYEINEKAENEIRAVLDHLQAQNRALLALYTQIEAQTQRIADLQLPIAPADDEDGQMLSKR